MIIRGAVIGDLDGINNIYNEAVQNSTATFDTVEKTYEERLTWFEKRDERFVVLVAEINGEIAGWASLNQYSDRKAYDMTCENSLYVNVKFRRQGVGQKLLEASITAAKKNKFHSILSRITKENSVSLVMHERAGFFRVGTMIEVGEKFGKMLDVELMQKII